MGDLARYCCYITPVDTISIAQGVATNKTTKSFRKCNPTHFGGREYCRNVPPNVPHRPTTLRPHTPQCTDRTLHSRKVGGIRRKRGKRQIGRTGYMRTPLTLRISPAVDATDTPSTRPRLQRPSLHGTKSRQKHDHRNATRISSRPPQPALRPLQGSLLHPNRAQIYNAGLIRGDSGARSPDPLDTRTPTQHPVPTTLQTINL